MSSSTRDLQRSSGIALPQPITFALLRRIGVAAVLTGLLLAFLLPALILKLGGGRVAWSDLALSLLMGGAAGILVTVFCAGLVLSLIFAFRLFAVVLWFIVCTWVEFARVVVGRVHSDAASLRQLRDAREPVIGLAICLLLMLPAIVCLSFFNAGGG